LPVTSPIISGRALTFVRHVSTAPVSGEAATMAEKSTEKQKDEDGKKEKADDDDGPMGWGKFTLYLGSGFSSLIFLYYFYQARYDLHQTEILLLDRFRRLPLYWPAGGSVAEANTAINAEGLPPDVVSAFCEWFIATDLQETGGVVREDVLELFEDLGLSEDHPAAKDYLHRGEGQLEEQRRFSGAGLQESVVLLAKMAAPTEGSGWKVGEEAVKTMQRKTRRAATAMAGATAVGQAMQMAGASSVQMPTQGLSNTGSAAAAMGSSSTHPRDSRSDSMGSVKMTPASMAQSQQASSSTQDDDDDDEDMSEAEEQRMELARLTRTENDLLLKLERIGSLSPAEEARLLDVRQRKSKLV